MYEIINNDPFTLLTYIFKSIFCAFVQCLQIRWGTLPLPMLQYVLIGTVTIRYMYWEVHLLSVCVLQNVCFVYI